MILRIKSILARTKDWIIEHQTDVILVVGVMLISLLSFAMGYIFAKQQDKPPIRFEATTQINNIRSSSARE